MLWLDFLMFRARIMVYLKTLNNLRSNDRIKFWIYKFKNIKSTQTRVQQTKRLKAHKQGFNRLKERGKNDNHFNQIFITKVARAWASKLDFKISNRNFTFTENSLEKYTKLKKDLERAIAITQTLNMLLLQLQLFLIS